MEKRLKILFISRAYPPIVGGIENQNYELSLWLARITDLKLIANRKGKIFLPFFIPYVLLRSLFIVKDYDAVLLGDAVLGIVGWWLKIFSKKPIIMIAHGLDLTFRSGLYQKVWINIFLRSVDKMITVGNETRKIALEKGMAEEKVSFVPNGVDPDKFFDPNPRKAELEKFAGERLEDKKIILTSGRLAKRKGVAWFIENVMPKLPENVIYLVAGDGPDRQNIEQAVRKNHLEGRVKILGYVTDETRNILMNNCDAFIQPNIPVAGDLEGFGISVLEAASCQIPVIASDLEGLKDAVKDGYNGLLVKPEDAEGYRKKITELLEQGNARNTFGKLAREFTSQNFAWEKVAEKYLGEIRSALKTQS